MMNNDGKLIAHDRDRHRLRPIFERMTRSGATCIDVLAAENTKALAGRSDFDCVLIDAPCSGAGSWRRKPDAKWKFTEKLLSQRLKDQRDVLTRGSAMVRPGGRLVYITCSVLPVENTDQVAWFLSGHKDFKVIPFAKQWQNSIGGAAPSSADGRSDGLLLTPHSHSTDGFFVTVLRRDG